MMSTQHTLDGDENPVKANPNNAKPVVFEGQTFCTQGLFIEHLASKLGLTKNQVLGRLYAVKWDIGAAVTALRQQAAATEAPPLAPASPPPPRIKPPKQSNHGNSIACLCHGRLFPSKSALAADLAARSGLSIGAWLPLLFDPEGDLGSWLDYFLDRLKRCPHLVGDGRLPLVFEGRMFFSARKLAQHLCDALEVSPPHATAILWGLGGDVTDEVEAYCRYFDLPYTAPATPTPPPAASPPRPTEVMAAPIVATDVSPRTADLPHEITEQLDRIRLAFTEQDEAISVLQWQLKIAQTTLPPADVNAPEAPAIERQLQAYNTQLEHFGTGLRRLEISIGDTRKQVLATNDMFRVILQKLGQLAHDANLRSPHGGMRAPHHTRQQPLGMVKR